MPTKTKEKKSETESTRRSFLNIFWIILGGVALVEFVAVAIAFLRPRKSKARGVNTDSIVTAGSVEGFAPNSVTAFINGKFYLARLKDGGFLALSRTCTHLGCTVPWVAKEMKFACPCHGSAFDITGNVIEAPAPRALDTYPISIENEIIKVDTRNPIKRSAFRVEQVTYPKKKV
ncbi:MAG: ubiquinol-cytochrome c reductase iron-sulfur subunit [Desulfobacterales bacterium]|jgi:cytochrome b6-f complex iron-sulfur subunit|nr:ubiquinol-cytochrome c reductase iron-sulfur subunit [Desulfobacterales bacterium]